MDNISQNEFIKKQISHISDHHVMILPAQRQQMGLADQ
jgi:hypothetical protein